MLSLLLKPVSGLCNMNCSYCFYRDEISQRSSGNSGIMSEKTLENILKRALDYSPDALLLGFQGGEPLLRGLPFYERLIELEERQGEKGRRIQHSLQTNGLLLDEAWCRFFKRHNFLIGLSLDGVRESHDRYRRELSGAPSYQRILERLRLLQRWSVDFNLLTVIHEDSAARITEIYQSYRSLNCLYQQYIPCLDPPAASRRGCGSYLSPESYGRMLIELFQLWYDDFKKGDPPHIRIFENYLSLLLGAPPEACDMLGHCSLQYTVEADGSVYPCDFYCTDPYCLGNLNRDSFPDLNRRFRDTDFVQRSLPIPEECRRCSFYPLCRNGCYRQRCIEGGDPRPRNRYCRSFRIFFEACLPQLIELSELLMAQSEGMHKIP